MAFARRVDMLSAVYNHEWPMVHSVISSFTQAAHHAQLTAAAALPQPQKWYRASHFCILHILS